MGLREQLMVYRSSWDAILAVATCRDSLGFADLWFPPLDVDAHVRRLIEKRDPGVIFETGSRVVVLEEFGHELRFYAGGWGNEVEVQPNELGVFRNVEDAVQYAEAFLVQRLHPSHIMIQRRVT
jgi:hypothetical protein